MLASTRDHVLTGPGDAAIVMVELNIRRKVAGVLIELPRFRAVIECIEHRRVQRRHSAVKAFCLRCRRSIGPKDGGGCGKGSSYGLVDTLI